MASEIPLAGQRQAEYIFEVVIEDALEKEELRQINTGNERSHAA